MKACRFCGAETENGAARCPSCGSTVFQHICENCGTRFDSGFCPNCGVKAGQPRKTCPECGTAYFSNACPNCGYTPSARPTVQQVVHTHVYRQEAAPQPAARPRKRNRGCGCLVWMMIILMILGGVGGSRIGRNTGAKPAATETPDPKATPERAVAAAQARVDRYFESLSKEKGKPAGKLQLRRSKAEGRGALDSGRQEPDYTGVLGYAAVSAQQQLEKNAAFALTPWKIPVYQKDKQFWNEAGSIDHKTEVAVIGQELEMPRYTALGCSGYLRVIRMDTGADCWLNVKNFVTAAYWKTPVKEAREKGYCVAAYRQKSDYYPITGQKKKAPVAEGAPVLLPMRAEVRGSSPDSANCPIAGIVPQEGGGPVSTAYFNPADLTLIY